MRPCFRRCRLATSEHSIRFQRTTFAREATNLHCPPPMARLNGNTPDSRRALNFINDAAAAAAIEDDDDGGGDRP